MVTPPACGFWKPERTLTRVVLPAPFGPIRPSTSPRRSVSEISASATRPPKRTVTEWAQVSLTATQTRGRDPPPATRVREGGEGDRVAVGGARTAAEINIAYCSRPGGPPPPCFAWSPSPASRVRNPPLALAFPK